MTTPPTVLDECDEPRVPASITVASHVFRAFLTKYGLWSGGLIRILEGLGCTDWHTIDVLGEDDWIVDTPFVHLTFCCGYHASDFRLRYA
jgi:hypothetical protein